MKKKFFFKCFIVFGLLLIFTSLIPFTAWNVSKVKAASVEVEKEGDYKLNVKSIPLVKGKTYNLKVYNLNEGAKAIYKSDDVEVASVSENGEITAIKVGVTKVTATVKNGAAITNLECEVTVGLPAFSVKLTKSRIILGLDKNDFLNVILKPSNTVENAKFSSYDSSIASVSPGGRISARKIGLTYVFAEIDATNSDNSRKYSRCTVIVTKQEDASTLESYLNNHPELDYIVEDDLNKALYEFFNSKYDATSSTSLTDSLNNYLDDKFDLDKLSAQRESDLAKLQSNSLVVNSGN